MPNEPSSNPLLSTPKEPKPSSLTRLQLWSGLILLAIFLAGVAAGAGVVRWLRPSHPFFPGRPFPREGPPILHELDLTAEQHAKVKTLFEHERTQMDALIQETFPRVREVHQQTDQQLKSILTPEQYKKWEQRPRPPHGPGGPMGDHIGHMMGPPGFGGPPPPFGDHGPNPPPPAGDERLGPPPPGGDDGRGPLP